jgi:hypothetical protein
MVAALADFLLLSQSAHAQSNNMNFRYFMIPAMAVVFLIASYSYGLLVWTCSALRPQVSAALRGLLAALLLPCAIIVGISHWYQLPRGFCFVDDSREVAAHTAATGGYVAVLGSYWDVWPMVFRTAILHRGRDLVDQRLLPTSYRSELMSTEITRRIRRDFLRNGSARFLCIVPGAAGTDVPGLDCLGLLKWNRDWGTLPNIGLGVPAEVLPVPDGLKELAVRPTALLPNQEVSFKAGGNGGMYQFTGWSAPESFGSWTLGPRAELAFSLEALPPEELMLQTQLVTDIGKFASPVRSLAVDVLINDEHLSRWAFNPDAGDHKLRIPSRLLHTEGNFLRFEIYSPHSGLELGFSPTDLRPLGFALASVRWVSDGSLAATAALSKPPRVIRTPVLGMER